MGNSKNGMRGDLNRGQKRYPILKKNFKKLRISSKRRDKNKKIEVGHGRGKKGEKPKERRTVKEGDDPML